MLQLESTTCNSQGPDLALVLVTAVFENTISRTWNSRKMWIKRKRMQTVEELGMNSQKYFLSTADGHGIQPSTLKVWSFEWSLSICFCLFWSINCCFSCQVDWSNWDQRPTSKPEICSLSDIRLQKLTKKQHYLQGVTSHNLVRNAVPCPACVCLALNSWSDTSCFT